MFATERLQKDLYVLLDLLFQFFTSDLKRILYWNECKQEKDTDRADNTMTASSTICRSLIYWANTALGVFYRVYPVSPLVPSVMINVVFTVHTSQYQTQF